MKLFNFEKDQVTRFVEYELDTFNKFKEPLNYVINELDKLGMSLTIKSLDKNIDLNKIKEREGKNYQWSCIKYKDVTLVIRRYNQHLTIFTKVIKESDVKGRIKSEYGAFTFNTNFDKFGDKHDEMMDKYYDKPFTDLNVIIKDLINLLIEKNGGVYWVWNSACLKVPDHMEIKLAFSQKNISSLDNFIFCMEELSTIYTELFAENTMLQKIKELKSGDQLNDRYKIGKVITEVKDNYYHGAGIELIDTMNKDQTSFQDVYSLTRWHFNDIFKNIYLYNGEAYIQGGEFKEGEPVAYKNEEIDNVTLFKDTYPKENFIALIKY